MEAWAAGLVALVGVLLLLQLHSQQRSELASFVTVAQPSAPPAAGPRCQDLGRTSQSAIPTIVHWNSETSRLQPRVAKLVSSWPRIMGNSVLYMFWNSSRRRQLIRKRYPQLLGIYDNELVSGLERSDIWRLAVLHHIGGMYVDLDVELAHSVLPLMLAPNSTAVWSQDAWEHVLFHYKRTRLLFNSVILSQPKHPFLEFVLSRWPAWFRKKWAPKRKEREKNLAMATGSTGPFMLDEMYDTFVRERPKEAGQMLVADADLLNPPYRDAAKNARCSWQCKRLSSAPDSQRKCEQLKAASCRRPVVPQYTVHRYLHTGYARDTQKLETVPVHQVLNVTECEI